MSEAVLSDAELSRLKGKYDEVAVRSHSINTRCYTDAKFLDIERKQISLAEDTIKELGSYKATVKLHKEVVVTVNFEVVGE